VRAVQLLAFTVLAAAGAVPCLAQSLESKDGVNVGIERFSADARVDEGVALVEVDETFRNAQPVQREGVCRFRLPADAVVSSFSMWMNGVEKDRPRARGRNRSPRLRLDRPARARTRDSSNRRDGATSRSACSRSPANDTVRIPSALRVRPARRPRTRDARGAGFPSAAGRSANLRVHAAFAAARGLATLDCRRTPQRS